ncbi:MAG: LPS export ABC transporter periplasmic protein LptC [Brevinematia bacterium]
MRKITLLTLLLITTGCYYDVDPPVIKVEPKIGTNNVLLVSKEFKYFGTDPKTKRKLWELIAEKSVIYKNNEVDLENVEIKFFKNNNLSSVLKGKVGKIHTEKNRAEIRDNVVLENYENETKVYSSRLIWDGNKRIIYNTESDKTTIVSPTAKLKGTGLRTTPDMSPLELKNVEALVE